MDGKNPILNSGSVFSGCNDMKRSPSEMALRELFASSEDERKIHHKVEIFDHDAFFAMENGGNMPLPLDNSEILERFSGASSLVDTSFWSQNVNPNLSNVSATIDSKSSCRQYNPVESAMSVNNPKGSQTLGASSGSSPEQSDDDDLEAGPCEESMNPIDLKRFRRMVSNRESARRSRRRKQAHLTELEQQVEQLRGENSSLFKQLADASQQFKDATTNNRVLKSDVEALRAKVKLAEDLVARGSLTSSLSHLIQNYLNTTPQDYISSNMNHMDNFPPVMSACGDENSAYTAIPDSAIGLENAEALSGNSTNGVIGDNVNHVADMWAWQSHVAPVSKR